MKVDGHWLTWIDYDYDSDDPHRGNQRRAARGRTLLARNDRGYLFATFVYWVDDAPWAVPCWDRIIASVEPAP